MAMLYIWLTKTKSLQFMTTKSGKSFLATTPSALLALITFFVSLFLLFGIGEGIGGEIGENLAYILSDLVIAICCYIIIKHNPRSFWYVPVICNLIGIIAAIGEHNFWITTMWIYNVSGWVISVIASIIGARNGRKVPNSDWFSHLRKIFLLCLKGRVPDDCSDSWWPGFVLQT